VIHDRCCRGRVTATVLTGVLVVTGCGSDDGTATEVSAQNSTAAVTTAEAATATPGTAATTAAPSTTAAATTTAAIDAVEPWSMDALGPGTFVTAVMEPAFTLTYGEGWVPFMPESRNQLNIEIPESSELDCAPCALFGVSAAEADAPEDVIAFATANGLELSDPEEVDVGGIAGQRYEVIGGEGVIFESEFSQFGVDSADGPARFTVLEVGGRVIVIHELAMPQVVDTVWRWSDDVIDSIAWSTD
jgi:hypothetical protein